MCRLGAIAAMATICGSGTVWAQVSKKSAEENAKMPVTAVVADVSEGDLNGASPISQGLLLDGLIAQWHATADGSNYKLVKDDIDHHMKPDGSLDVSGMDAISLGQSVLTLYRVTLDQKYFKVAQTIYDEALSKLAGDEKLASPANYALLPFVAGFAAMVKNTKGFDAAAGALLSHDASQQGQPVAERSHTVRPDAVAWHAAALVDTLQWLPESYGKRDALIEELRRSVPGALAVPEGPGPGKNIGGYAALKAVRLGWASTGEGTMASPKASTPANGTPSTEDEAKPAHDTGLVAAEKLFESEKQQESTARLAQKTTVGVDAWFNHQFRKNALGEKELFHYKWNDDSDSGFSLFGQMLARHGATLDTLYQSPTLKRLSGAQFYIIVSPDIPAKNPQPHYVQRQDADQVAEWVKQGGVLLLMENDPANADISHLNLIAERFGIHFDDVLKHHVIGDQFAPGFIPVAGDGPVFQHPYTLYMKDTCAISLKGAAKSLLEDKAGIVIATAKYGKGTVVAVVDPWLYNEYTDPRKLLPRQDNYAAGEEFVSWLLKQAQPGISPAADPHSVATPTRDKDSQ